MHCNEPWAENVVVGTKQRANIKDIKTAHVRVPGLSTS